MIHVEREMCESWQHVPDRIIVLTSEYLAALRQIVNDRRRPLTHILRARIVLLSDERLSGIPTARAAL